MVRAVGAVQANAPHDLASHRLAVPYGAMMAERLARNSLPASTLRTWFTHICDSPRRPAEVSGPVWPSQPKPPGMALHGRRGLAQEATWGPAPANGWLSGHGPCRLTPQQGPLVGMLQGMSNTGHEAKRLAQEMSQYDGMRKKVCRDSQAAEQERYGRRQTP